MMVFAIVAPWIAPGDPTEVVLSERYLPLWSDGHALGTDHLGRDYHSRLIVGGRLSIMAGLIPAFGAMVAGLVIGMTSGYFGGWVDSVLMRIIDVLLAFPFLLLVILMVAVLGTDIRNAMIALMIGGTPGTARTLRSLVLSIKQRPFVEAAEVSGLGGWRIIRYEIFPNVLPLAVALMTIQMSWMIVAIAGLSFLGLGVRPPDADWGTLLSRRARPHLQGPVSGADSECLGGHGFVCVLRAWATRCSARWARNAFGRPPRGRDRAGRLEATMNRLARGGVGQ